MFSPIRYEEPVFRPPAEAYSAIIQATIGCSWNKCAFCEMYTTKEFRAKTFSEIQKDIKNLSSAYGPQVKKVFLADGDAFILSASRMIQILDEVNENFTRLARVSAYALPKNILQKTDEELLMIREKGLKLLYIGIESGDDELLNFLNKGENFETTYEGISKAHKAGFDTSIMIINGLGGKRYSEQHALNSARIINKLNPKFLSTLTLSFPFGPEHFKKRISFDYRQQSVVELLEELYLFIDNLDVSNVIFRSNHVSNNLALKGTLSKDKEKVLIDIKNAIDNTPADMYPPEAISSL